MSAVAERVRACLTEIGWGDRGRCDFAGMRDRLTERVMRVTGRHQQDAHELLARWTGKGALAVREVLFDGVVLGVRGARDKIALCGLPDRVMRASDFATVEETAEFSDIILILEDVPLVQIRAFPTREAMDDGFASFSREAQQGESPVSKFIQMVVFTCGHQTLYYSDPRCRRAEDAFVWTDEDNEPLDRFEDFSRSLLDPMDLREYLRYYTLGREEDGIEHTVVLRPYQYHASRLILEQVRLYGLDSRGSPVPRGHIWHSTGSGKTITMARTAMNILRLTSFDKVVIVVDRLDLDEQTVRVIERLIGSGNRIRNTNALKREMKRDTSREGRIIVTTLHKMSKIRKSATTGKIVFLFDECHRSQDGKSHQAIIGKFHESPYFGVTGTPIHLPATAAGQRTTEAIFGQCLHRYLMKDACRDNNVLPFNLVYANALDRDGEQVRVDFSKLTNIRRVAGWIMDRNDALTMDRRFASIVTVSSVRRVKALYEEMCRINEERGLGVRVGVSVSSPSFSPQSDDADANEEPLLPEQPDEDPDDDPTAETDLPAADSEEFMRGAIRDYADLFGLGADERATFGRDLGAYRADLARRVRQEGDEGVDILLVVGQFITGFDAPRVNTVYVMRNSSHHNLIQTISRSNRPCGPEKPYGNAVFFSTAEKCVSEALTLYNHCSIEDLNGFLVCLPYDELISRINRGAAEAVELIRIHPRWGEEEEQRASLLSRRIAADLRSVVSHVRFSPDDLPMPERDIRERARELREMARRAPLGGAGGPDKGSALIERIEAGSTTLLTPEALRAILPALPMRSFERHFRAISYLPDERGEVQEAIREMMGLVSRTARDAKPEELRALAEIVSAFAAEWAEQRRVMTRALAAAAGLTPEPAVRLVEERFEARSGKVSVENARAAGFPFASFGAFLRAHRALEILIRAVSERYPRIESLTEALPSSLIGAMNARREASDDGRVRAGHPVR